MGDPTGTTATIAIGGGIGAAFASLFGIEPSALIWAFVGSSIAMWFAEPMGRVKSATLFVAASFICALFGTYLAVRWSDGSALVIHVLTAGLAIGFHKWLPLSLQKVPKIFDWFVEKMFPSRAP